MEKGKYKLHICKRSGELFKAIGFENFSPLTASREADRMLETEFGIPPGSYVDLIFPSALQTGAPGVLCLGWRRKVYGRGTDIGWSVILARKVLP